MSTAKMLLFGVRSVMVPVRVKTAATFIAEDPWNANRRSTFKLEEYLQMFEGQKLPETAKATGTDYRRALRSDTDGVEHWLPDSLSELYRTKQVSLEALPQLLKDAELGLKRGDYVVVLRNKALWLLTAISTLICLSFVAFTIVALANSDVGLIFKIVATLILAAMCWLCLYVAYYRVRFRRKRQMKTFLERANVNGLAASAAHPVGSYLQ